MATKKAEGNPRFPHPPLDVGVAQYPTPLVPNYNDKTGGWSISDQGHIILQEKVSIEKGSFTPLPLDGSVTYTGRDANKWPSTLYLVAERPTPDAEFIFRYWANDRSISSQNLWNYNIAYSSEDVAAPIYTRSYIVPRVSYDPNDFLGTDPLSGSSTFVKLQMAELPEDNPLASRYVAVQAVYETLPGPILTGYQYDPDLNLIITNTKQTLAAGAAAPSLPDNGNKLISSRDEPLDKWRTVRIQSKISALPAARTEYKTGSYGSPNLLTGFDNSFFVFPDGQIQYNVTPVMRAKRSYQTAFKYETSYQYNQPTAPGDTLFDPLAINVYYDGYFFKVNIPDCLTDPNLSINFSTGSGNASAAYYGPINETYTVPTTTLHATDYKALVGSYQLISYEIDYWKANVWRTSKQYVLLK
jgi:hypothetical protein